MLPVWCRLWGLFLSTPSARRATFCGGSGGSGWPISIHALREEGDAYEPFHLREKIEISIHALREEGDECREHAGRNQCISIHALREEGDQRQPCIVAKLLYFYPRPPRGGRPSGGFAMGYVTKFLSTPSARRATRRYIRRRACCRDFYPRPPRGGRQGGCAYELCHLWISIHALREEGDSTAGIMCRRPTNFYPRPPRGGRQTYLGHFMVLTNFYPRPPRGGRPIKCKGVFQMTVISIHALREEGD